MSACSATSASAHDSPPLHRARLPRREDGRVGRRVVGFSHVVSFRAGEGLRRMTKTVIET
jgi:hypothetical protein